MKTVYTKKFIIIILLSTLFMGSSFPSGKYLIHNESIPPFWLGGWRFLIAGIMLLIILSFFMGLKEIVPSSKGSIKNGFLIVFLTGCLQTAGAMGFLNLALKTLDSSISSIVFFTNPLWLAIMSHFFLDEKLKGSKIISLIVGVIGIVICLGLHGHIDSKGMLFAFAGSVCWSSCTLLSKKTSFDKSILVLSAWQMLLGGIILLIISNFTNESYSLHSANYEGIIWFFWLVIPASIGSFCLWFMALNIGGATYTSCFLFLVPFFSTVFSVITLHDRLTIQLVIGGFMVIASLWLINKSEYSKPEKE